MKPAWRVLLPALVFLGILGLALWVSVAYQPDGGENAGNGYKRLSGTVAEGFAYRVGRERHPRVTCSACRVGKMKLGLVSLGAFNTVEIDDLVINIPEAATKTSSNRRTKEANAQAQGLSAETDAVVEALNLKPVMAMAKAEARRFAGIKISNFQVNRMSGESLRPVIKAALLKNSGRRIMLYSAVLYKDGERFNLDSVELVVKPRFKLLWSTGTWDLTEMLSMTQ